MKFFEGPVRFAHYPRKESILGLWGNLTKTKLEPIDQEKIFWETTGNYLFLQDAKY